MQIQFKCQVESTLPFTSLLPFQGQLKSRTPSDIEKLAASISDDGLLMPFVVWHKPNTDVQLNYLLDGHARYAAIQKISHESPEVLSQEYPILVIVAESIDEAKNALLQISSSYGKITSKGLQTFIANAPRINVNTLGIKVKPPKVKVPKEQVATAPKPINDDESVLIKLRVRKDSVEKFINLLVTYDFVELV